MYSIERLVALVMCICKPKLDYWIVIYFFQLANSQKCPFNLACLSSGANNLVYWCMHAYDSLDIAVVLSFPLRFVLTNISYDVLFGNFDLGEG